jgi:hypothetical protein
MTATAGLGSELRSTLEARGEPGVVELVEALRALLGQAALSGRGIDLKPLKGGVYRLRLTEGGPRSVILKRSEPAIAHLNRLVAERWLPALGLGNRCARLLATVPDREGRWFWQVHEDLGEETLAQNRDRSRVLAVTELVAELHARGRGHAVLPEVRHHAKDLGLPFFTSNVGDAVRGLEELDGSGPEQTEMRPLRDRLLKRLYPLLADTPRRVRVLQEANLPDTFLHGDLWRDNAFALVSPEGVHVRLIDWDHVGVGPLTYDLSTFLLRFSPNERPWILARYRQVLSLAGWRLPAERELNVLFETAEYARFANRAAWAAMAWLQDGADWVPIELAEIARWFEAWRPVLAE